MGKQQLSMCGGNCKEKSAKTELYAPFKPLANGIRGPVYFRRALYCINHGCGWRAMLPIVEISPETVLNNKSAGVRAYFRRTQKRFAELNVKICWKWWVYNAMGSFEAYLSKLEMEKKQR